MSSEETHKPEDYETDFDPDAYLRFYFGKESIEDGTRMSLFALPVFAHTIKSSMAPEERETLLDIGAGPTVYSALCFRDVVKRIYLSDYLSKNLDVLKAWKNNTSIYDWKPTIKVIMRTEGGQPFREEEMDEVEEKARGAVKCGGIMYANVHDDPVVPDMKGKQANVLVSIFTLESACQNYTEYCQCVKNMVNHLRPGGRFVLGSVLEEESYNSGKGVIFHLLYLSEDQILNAMGSAGIDLDSVKKYVLKEDGVIFLMAIKK
ncbi:unnamed protein product [Cylicocyclus nassatus]|uniref:NNMT/PNMT/TEMT family protein n=1 Tax=Cylicocyclus nassatus TaxID=53992 RepID=A0AA36GT85_CYLNA|nr:unnamed protein product [Cylicocyclus nassatus]